MIRNLIAAFFALSLCAQPSSAASPTPPGEGIAGYSPEQLSSQWWQWALSAPDASNPVEDKTGEHCATGQSGPVWFLAGGFGSSKIRRTCVLPAGKSVFFPVINMIYMSREGGVTFTCEEAKRAAARNNNSAIDLYAEIDGVPIQDIGRFRVTSQTCFHAFARIPAAQRSKDGFPAASDGYWLLLKPLKKGRYLLKFGGRYNNRRPSAYRKMVQDIEYELVVK